MSCGINQQKTLKMAALIRVKRCLNEDPSETFILKCKKRKIDNSNEPATSKEDEVQTTILKFAGTINKDDNVFTHIKEKILPDSEELKTNFKKHTVNLTDKLRLEHQEASKNSRYKIVNLFRSPNLDTPEKVSGTEETKYDVTILDVETDVNENNTETVNKNNDGVNKYVYDLYYTNSDDFGQAEIEEYVSIYPLNDPLLIRSAKDDLGESSSDDSEDSNAENNWRNDYPDEDDMESINEDDMVEAMKKVDLEDLSSDDGEEGYVYCADSDAEYEDALDEGDVNHFGKRYAEFKAKHKGFVETTSFKNSDLYYGDIDEDEYYY